MEQNVTKMHALGRRLKLGAFYNYCDDSIITGM